MVCGWGPDAHAQGAKDHAFWAAPEMTLRATQELVRVPRPGHYGLREQRIRTQAAPAAGVDIVATVPATNRWKLWTLSASLVTSAAVANRVPHLVITDGQGNTAYNCPANQNQVAATTIRYSVGAGVFAVTFDNAYVFVAPVEMDMLQGWTIGFLTTGLQAGDQWGVMGLFVGETLYF